MRKLTGTFIVFCAIFYANAAKADIVVEKSPFSSATFLIESNASTYADPEEKGKIDAKYGAQPNGELTIVFDKVIKDKDLLRFDDFLPDTRVYWSKLQIKIDGQAKGMTLSYEREPGSRELRKVVLHVPSIEDYVAWHNAADRIYERYVKAFNQEREMRLYQEKNLEESKRKRERALERQLYILRNGPILVYPNE